MLRMPDAQKIRTRITLTATANLDLWEMAMNFVKVRWCRGFNGLQTFSCKVLSFV